MRVNPAARRVALPLVSLLAVAVLGAGAVLYVPPPREYPGRPLLASSRRLSAEEFREAAALRGGSLYAGMRDNAKVELQGGRTLRFVRDGAGCALVLEPPEGGRRVTVRRWPAGDDACREKNPPSFLLSPDRGRLMYSLRPDPRVVGGRYVPSREATPVRIRALPLAENATEREWRLLATREEVDTGLVFPSWRPDGRAIRVWRRVDTLPAPSIRGDERRRLLATPGGVLMETGVEGTGGWREVARLADRRTLPLAIAALSDGTSLAVRMESGAAATGSFLYGEVGGLQASVSARLGAEAEGVGAKLRFLRYREPEVGAAESVAVLDLPEGPSQFALSVSADGSRVALTGTLPEERVMGEMEYLRSDLLQGGRRRGKQSRLVRRAAFAVWTARLGDDRAFTLLGRESQQDAEKNTRSFRVVPAEGGFLLEEYGTEPFRWNQPTPMPRRQAFYRLPDPE